MDHLAFMKHNETSFNETSFISALKNIQKISHMMTKHRKQNANFYIEKKAKIKDKNLNCKMQSRV